LLAETAVLAVIGCGCGVALAAWVAPLTSGLMPVVLRGQLGLAMPTLDWRVLAFATAASLVSAFVAGIVPAFGSWRTSPQTALGDGGRTSSPGARQSRLLGALVIAETALTLVLLAGAGLVIRSFVRLQTMPLGFDTAHLLTMEIDLPAANDATGQARSALMHQLVGRVAASPGVTSAALTTVNPLGGGTWGATAISEEMAARNPNAALNVNHRLVTPGLLHTMGLPLLRGRDFTSGDRVGAAPVVIVSDRLARRVWPGDDPIGKRIRMTRARSAWMTVVGVAGDVADSHDPGVPFETWYAPYDQYPTTAAAAHVYVMARTAGDPLTSVTAVRQAIVGAGTSLVPYGATPMDRYYSDSLVRERVGAMFMLGFGTFGLALAALGVYGVMAFSVSQRTTEIAIRIALGAQQGQIVHAVAVRAIVLVAAGVALGLAGGAAVNRVLASILSEIAPADPAVLGGAAALILVTAAAACLLPALRAGRLDPIVALSRSAGL
jgi:putative ABC transport system permease protein